METIDEEIFAAADKFIDRSAREKKPFFVWFNTTRMHVWTHLKKASDGKTGIGLYPDGMAGAVGRALPRPRAATGALPPPAARKETGVRGGSPPLRLQSTSRPAPRSSFGKRQVTQ